MAGRTAYPRRRKAGGRARGAHIAILVIEAAKYGFICAQLIACFIRARRACKRRTRFGTNVAASTTTSAVRTGRAASTTPVPIPPPKQSARQNAKPPVKKAAANTAATARVYSRRRFSGKASANRSPHTIFPGRDNNGGKNNDAHAQQAPSADAMAMRRIGKRRAQSAAAMRSIRQSITKLSRRNSSIYICRPLPASTGTIPYAPCDMCRTNDAYIADNC